MIRVEITEHLARDFKASYVVEADYPGQLESGIDALVRLRSLLDDKPQPENEATVAVERSCG